MHLPWLLALQEGQVNPPNVKVGEKVLVPEYGGTKLTLDEQVAIVQISFEKQHEWFCFLGYNAFSSSFITFFSPPFSGLFSLQRW